MAFSFRFYIYSYSGGTDGIKRKEEQMVKILLVIGFIIIGVAGLTLGDEILEKLG